MRYSLFDKIVIFILLSINAVTYIDEELAVIVLMVAVAFSVVMEYIDSRRVKAVLFIVYSAVSVFLPEFLLMYPLICYSLIDREDLKYLTAAIPAVLVGWDKLEEKAIVYTGIVLIASIYIKYKTNKLKTTYNEYVKTRDNLTESSIMLKKRIKTIMDNQDNEVKLAALNERTRIAREIHDNVGHLLSSAILQLGAVIMTTDNEQTKESLTVLKVTLAEGMNSIRNSVHNLRDDSVDLYIYLKNMINEFTFCKAQLKYDVTSELDVKFRLNIIAIVKEALSNVIKHSAASEVTITFIEHPKLYQLIISDNGMVRSQNINLSSGMGLDSIRQRAEAFNGLVNISCEKGFRIFISFRKDNA